MEINEEYEKNIKDIISRIKEYFNDDAQNLNEDEIYKVFSKTNEKSIARKILDDYVSMHPEKTFRYIESKYLNYTFASGGSEFKLNDIKNNVYHFESINLSDTYQEEMVSVKIDIFIDIEKQEVINISYNEIQNTLKSL